MGSDFDPLLWDDTMFSALTPGAIAALNDHFLADLESTGKATSPSGSDLLSLPLRIEE